MTTIKTTIINPLTVASKFIFCPAFRTFPTFFVFAVGSRFTVYLHMTLTRFTKTSPIRRQIKFGFFFVSFVLPSVRRGFIKTIFKSVTRHLPASCKNAMPSHCGTRKDGETRRTRMALVMLTLYQLTFSLTAYSLALSASRSASR